MTRGYDVVAASGGHEGLGLYEEAHPDLVITDLNMPEGDGVYLAKALRDNGCPKSTYPIILITGTTVTGAKNDLVHYAGKNGITPEAAAELFDGVAEKPFEVGDLLAVIEHTYALKHGTPLPSALPREPSPGQ